MFHIFNSNVFVEIGEAIGNVSEKVFQRRSAADSVDKAFHKRLNAAGRIDIPALDEPCQYPDVEGIDVPFVVLETHAKETN
jgi:hypothetical protein